jgi:transcriptional antiterminator RfaH
MNEPSGNGFKSEHGGGQGRESLNPTAREQAWFCVRTRPKSEHIAAAHLRELESVEVFNPRIRFKRPRGNHKMWVTEALFPGYVFARFNWYHLLKAVHYTNGVTGVVHFGTQWPIIDDDVVSGWREALGEEELALCEEMPQPGEEVLITSGAFKGLMAEVIRVSSAQRRVAVLMEFLGQQVQLDLKSDQFTRPDAREKIKVPAPEDASE